MRILLATLLIPFLTPVEGKESIAPVSIRACLDHTERGAEVTWVVRNTSKFVLELISQTMPWGPHPYGAEIEIVSPVGEKDSPKWFTPGTDRSIVTLLAGEEVRGSTRLSSIFPQSQAALGNPALVLKWSYQFRPIESQRAWKFDGQLTGTTVCRS